MNEKAVLLVAGLAAGAYFYFGQPTAEPPAPSSAGPDPAAPTSGAAGVFDTIVGGIGQGIGGFFAAAGEGVGKAVGAAASESGLEDKDSDLRRNLKKFGDAHSEVAAKLGFTKSPSKKRRKKRKATQAVEAHYAAMQNFAARVHVLASRPDVREWVISSRGTGKNAVMDVYLTGRDAPVSIEVPPAGQSSRLAWIYEPIVRALGVPAQRGRRIGTPFVRFSPPAHDDRNPYAAEGSRVSDRQAVAQNTQLRNISRLGRKTRTKNFQAGLAALGAGQQQAAEEEQEGAS